METTPGAEQTAKQTSKYSAIDMARLKAASEAHKIHKSIFIDSVTEEPLEGFIPWPQFRDEFLADWKSNRRVVTEKEADVHFDTVAEEALTELETSGVPADVSALAEQAAAATETGEEGGDDETPIGVIVPNPTTGEPIAVATAPKRRGRPPGKAKLVAVEANDAGTVELVNVVPNPALKRKSYYVPVSQRKGKTTRKAAAKKKGGGTSSSSKAQTLIEKYQGRDWSRKDIIEKLQSQLGMGAAYASTLYQKFAK